MFSVMLHSHIANVTSLRNGHVCAISVYTRDSQATQMILLTEFILGPINYLFHCFSLIKMKSYGQLNIIKIHVLYFYSYIKYLRQFLFIHNLEFFLCNCLFLKSKFLEQIKSFGTTLDLKKEIASIPKAWEHLFDYLSGTYSARELADLIYETLSDLNEGQFYLKFLIIITLTCGLQETTFVIQHWISLSILTLNMASYKACNLQ